ncbi:MAG: glycosyltransferase [Candidatus Eisenbacteria bacterium]|nr:glycosyltransferase [Candidatus Eisenbacteria bacterium]
MHIVWVHRGMYPEHIGGTYTYIYELGRRLVARGHRVDVISRALSPENAGSSSIEGIGVHRYTYRRVNPIYSTYQHLNRCYAIFLRLAAEHPVDVLGIHDTHLGLKLARSKEGRAVCQIPTYHAPSFLEYRFDMERQLTGERNPLRRAIAKFFERSQRRFESGVLAEAQGILVLSEFTKANIRTHFPHVDIDKVKIIPSGVETDRFKPGGDKHALRLELGLDPDGLQLLTVRRLAPRMGLENLLKALAIVRTTVARDGRALRLVVCGGGPLLDDLSRLSEDLGIGDSVRLLGRVVDEDLIKHYQAADLFVLPTAALEGFGIVTVEALSANLPVIGTPAGATPEILGQLDERLLTRDTSAKAIADAISSWIKWRHEDQDPYRYREFAVANYAWENVADSVEQYYSEQLDRFRTTA